MVSPSLRATAASRRIAASSAVVLVLALPLVLLHSAYQPSVTVGLGSTSATATLSDLAVLVIGLAALANGFAAGFGPLRRGRILWLTGGLFLALVAAAT